jgi:O-antigen/teichoic acid export membrane protein
VEEHDMSDSQGTARAQARAVDDAGRDESEAGRIDRNLDELLQELRVASIGVQVLFGFLLSLPFTTRFSSLDDAQRTLYVLDLVFAALAAALFLAPVSYHRLVFRRHVKLRLLRTANVLAVGGLVCVALAITGAVLLVVSFVSGGAAMVAIALVVASTIFGLWFVLPLSARHRDRY